MVYVALNMVKLMGFFDCMIISPGSTDSGEITIRFS